MSQKEIAFMGRIIASLSHEIKNVLATIKESAGLMEDILSLRPETDAPHQARLVKAAGNIRKQVDRGVDVVMGLNRFAHSMDEPMAQIDLNELTAQMAFLMQRFAHKSAIGLSAAPYSESLNIMTDPFRLEMLLAAALDVCLTRADKGSGLVIQPCRVEGRPAVWIGAAPDEPPDTLPPTVAFPEDLFALKGDLEHLQVNIYDCGSAGLHGVLILFK